MSSYHSRDMREAVLYVCDEVLRRIPGWLHPICEPIMNQIECDLIFDIEDEFRRGDGDGIDY